MSPSEPARPNAPATDPGERDAIATTPDAPRERADLRGEDFGRFYDRLRRRIAEPIAGRVGEPLADVVLLAPDLFVLLVRLFTDRDVPAGTRSLVGGAIAYFVLPADLLPEMFLGPAGYLDDVVLAAALVSHVFSSDLRPFVERHWSGRGNVHDALESAVRAGEALLPSRLYQGLARVLARYGVDLGRAGRPGGYRESATTDDETYDYSRVT
jgi:uncharacterized membrane protein YkvA (DUF1232 family)